jgi:uncharacterized RDD family membrane protein YckC
MISSAMAVAAIGAIQSDRASYAREARLARVIALITDTMILALLTGVVNAVYGVTQVTSGSLNFQYSTATTVAWPWLTVLGVVYFTVPEAIFGASPGKLWARLRVIRVDGKPLTVRSVVIRNVLKPIDWLPILYLVGGVSVLITANSQRLGDRWAGTTVVYRHRALEPGATRSAGPAARHVLTACLVAAVLFTIVFEYFGRPPLVIEGLYNEHLMPIADAGYKLGSPQYSLGRVTYAVTGRHAGSDSICTGSITLEWSWLEWHESSAGFVCRPS